MSRSRDGGMVTAETAVVLPVLVVLLGGLLTLIGAVSTQLRCVDAAREGARAAARGDPTGAVVALVRRAAPDGASVTVTRGSSEVRVTVGATAPVLGGLVPGVRVSATATSGPEPDDADVGDAQPLGSGSRGELQRAGRAPPR